MQTPKSKPTFKTLLSRRSTSKNTWIENHSQFKKKQIPLQTQSQTNNTNVSNIWPSISNKNIKCSSQRTSIKMISKSQKRNLVSSQILDNSYQIKNNHKFNVINKQSKNYCSTSPINNLTKITKTNIL